MYGAPRNPMTPQACWNFLAQYRCMMRSFSSGSPVSSGIIQSKMLLTLSPPHSESVVSACLPFGRHRCSCLLARCLGRHYRATKDSVESTITVADKPSPNVTSDSCLDCTKRKPKTAKSSSTKLRDTLSHLLKINAKNKTFKHLGSSPLCYTWVERR